MKPLRIFFILFGALLVLASCTTQRKKGELSKLGKAWHNTTAHYNGYFNAQEMLEASILELSAQHEDNYLKMLDVYEYVNVDNPQAVAGELDEAVKKVTVVVNLHPYSQWSDDCYLLAGKSLYLKQDYEGAEKAFRFLIKEYPPERPKEEAKGRGGKGSDRSRSSASSSSSSSGQDKKMTAKERERARKKYNREVRKRKKLRARGKLPASTRSKTETPGADAPKTEETPATPAPKTEPPVGRVSLTAKDNAAFAENADQYRLKHRPAYQEAQLWLARTLIERDNYEGARRILTQMVQSPNTFNDLQKEAYVALAHLALRQKNYAEAANALQSAMENINNNATEARLAFILGQVQQELGSSAEAYAAFQKVVKLKPEYPMVFAAQLNMAQNAFLSGKGSAAEAIANLEKLLNDDKNKPYQDQIYYAMAVIALAQGDEASGMAYMEQCLASPSSNMALQGEAYYLLGNLAYKKEDYMNAKSYYDSALSTMAKTDDRYFPTARLRDNLVDIAKNLEIIALQDSLLRVAEMSPEEQAELAKKLSLQAKAGETAKTTTPVTTGGKEGIATFDPSGIQRGATPSLQTAVGSGGGAQASSFFAYDDKAVKRGEREFIRKWGTRTLEDNWRRSNRADAGFEEASQPEETEVNLLTQKQIDDILKDVPKDEGQKTSSKLLIKKAMFELGRLYRDRLNNYTKSIEVLAELDTQYPGNIHELESWYYLYLNYTDEAMSAKATEYKEKILSKYPSSNFAEIIRNPNYAQQFLNEERRLDNEYQAVYQLFEQKNFEEAFAQGSVNMNRLPAKHALKPRYSLMLAMCKGNMEGKEAYVAELQKVIATYPATEEETRSKEILRLLGVSGAALPGGEQQETGAFVPTNDELHYVIIVFDDLQIDLNAAKNKVSDYNLKYHELDKLRVSNVYLGERNDLPVLVLRRFKDGDDAMAYLLGSRRNPADFLDNNSMAFKIYPVSQTNYREILRSRTVQGYDTFVAEHYE